MPTVEEVLKQSGFTDDQISALDNRAITAFNGVLSTAEQARQAAELAQRANVDFYDNRIVPSLTRWDEEKMQIENEKARVAAEAAYYRTQNEAARQAGFIASDAPGYQPQRDQSGRYVANVPGGTPGSPTYTGLSADDIEVKLGQGLTNVAWAMQEYQRLNNGQYLPDNFDKLSQEATYSRMPFRQYVEQKYGFPAKRQEIEKQKQEAHDKEIADQATAANDRKWAERVGSNPDVRMSMRNVDPRAAEIARAVRSGKELPGIGKVNDPLLLNETERRLQTRAGIRAELSERE